MQYVPSLSDKDNSSELTETIPLATSTSDNDVRQLKITKFMPCWKYLFPWIGVECKTSKNKLLFCDECRAAGLKNDFSCRKSCPPKCWKKE